MNHLANFRSTPSALGQFARLAALIGVVSVGPGLPCSAQDAVPAPPDASSTAPEANPGVVPSIESEIAEEFTVPDVIPLPADPAELPPDMSGTLPSNGGSSGSPANVKLPSTDSINVPTGDTISSASGRQITLGEALRITVSQQPQIELAKADVQIAEAKLGLMKSVFDPIFVGEVRYAHERHPYGSSFVNSQRRARSTTNDLLGEVRALRESEAEGFFQLESAQAGLDLPGLSYDALSGSQLQILRELDRQASTIDALRGPISTEDLEDIERRLDSSLSGLSIDEYNEIDRTTYEVGVEKLFRNGVRLRPSVAFSQANDISESLVSLEVIVPLGKGRGAKAEKALERSAYHEINASMWLQRHTISETLAQTAIAYWNCQAAQDDYKTLRTSENIALEFVRVLDIRAKGGAISGGELSQALTRYTDLISDRVSSEFALLEARQQLALAMGLKDQALTDPPFASGSLPVIDISGLDSSLPAEETARARRDDRKVSQEIINAGRLLTSAAKHNIKPQVDLSASVGYKSIDERGGVERLVSTYGSNATGPSFAVGLSVNWPFRTRAAKSTYKSTQADLTKRLVSAGDLDRVIGAAVNLSVNQVRNSRFRLNAAQAAVDFASQALENERVRFEEGQTTVLDQVQLERAFTEALRNRISVEALHAASVTQLRFVTGTVLAASNDPKSVQFDPTQFATVPDFSNIGSSKAAALPDPVPAP